MTRNEPDEVVVSSRVASAGEQLKAASEQRARWEAEEARLKELIFEGLGYDPEDPKPQPVVAVDPEGHRLFRVTVGTWRGLDQKALKTERPDVYATFETSKSTKSIRF